MTPAGPRPWVLGEQPLPSKPATPDEPTVPFASLPWTPTAGLVVFVVLVPRSTVPGADEVKV